MIVASANITETIAENFYLNKNAPKIGISQVVPYTQRKQIESARDAFSLSIFGDPFLSFGSKQHIGSATETIKDSWKGHGTRAFGKEGRIASKPK